MWSWTARKKEAVASRTSSCGKGGVVVWKAASDHKGEAQCPQTTVKVGHRAQHVFIKGLGVVLGYKEEVK